MNINLTAHDILGHLSQNKWRKDKLEDGTPTYELMMYEWVTFDSICKVFRGRDPKELRYSMEELIKNGHVEKQPTEYWKEVRSLEIGEIAFEKRFYLKAYRKEKTEDAQDFIKRYWIIPILIGTAIGIGGTILTNTLLQSKPQSEEAQSKTTVNNDSTGVRNNKSDSTNHGQK